jgi:hypothetical protein
MGTRIKHKQGDKGVEVWLEPDWYDLRAANPPAMKADLEQAHEILQFWVWVMATDAKKKRSLTSLQFAFELFHSDEEGIRVEWEERGKATLSDRHIVAEFPPHETNLDDGGNGASSDKKRGRSSEDQSSGSASKRPQHEAPIKESE